MDKEHQLHYDLSLKKRPKTVAETNIVAGF